MASAPEEHQQVEQVLAAQELVLVVVWAEQQIEEPLSVMHLLLGVMSPPSGMMNPQSVVVDPLSEMMNHQKNWWSSLDDGLSQHVCAQLHHRRVSPHMKVVQ